VTVTLLSKNLALTLVIYHYSLKLYPPRNKDYLTW